ncbi:tetratricopeptide repeat protein [Streptomyces filipinensis]|uniref:Tetratricopeptide repeat protein n=1 Tax=Streptomyces filipinensis TaxID=66887 RepID=A0A918MFS0_9ACTN|nr:tetratricopeptide repeat protein [Streptomyces filipinensis]GGV22438.1 tetratricopeptide repeat protein [Streptomyces filipinensis]
MTEADRAAARAVTLGADNYGIISTGDDATNVLVVFDGPPPSPVDTGFPSPPVSLSPAHVAGAPVVGRETEIAELHAALSEAAGPGLIVRALTGLGGVGKSTLANHYAEVHRGGHALIHWLSAENPDEIEAGLAGLAARLDSRWAETAPPSAAAWATAWLGAHRGWLLILDNVNDRSDITPLLARLAEGRFLITTRLATGWRGIQTLAVGTLAPEAAAKVLRGAGAELDDAAAADLCRALGHLPLALDQAGAYLEETRTEAREYLRLLADDRASTLRDAATGTARDRTVSAVWSVTLDRLAEQEPVAVELLRALAWFAPTGIPRRLLDPMPDQAAANRAVGRLNAYSMITLKNDDGDPVGARISVHRLVQAVTRTPEAGNPHRSADAVREGWTNAVALLSAAFPAENALADTATWRLLLPHIDALFAESAAEDPLPLADALFMNTAIHLIQQSQQHRAVPYLVHALRARERDFGPRHPLALTMRVALASAYEESGDLARAIPLFETAFADRRDVLGPDHPETHTSRVRLASAYEAAGRLDLAIEQLGQALDDSERVFGRNHPCTLMARNNLAHAFDSAGRPDLAIPLYTEVLADHEGVRGRDHPNTLTARHNLAYARGAAGRPDQAISLYTELIEDMKRVLGPDHPQTLSTGNNLASAYRSLGDLERATELYERTADDRARVLGPDHPDTLTSRSDLALIYQVAGDGERAIPLAEAVLADRRRVLSTDHPDILTSLNILAGCYDAVGATDRAIALYEEVVRDRTRVLGSNHPDTLMARNNLACALAEAGDLATAIPVLHTVLRDRIHVLGRDHPHSITSRGTLGGAYRRAGDFDSALTYYREALADAQRVLGEGHGLTAQLQNRVNTRQDW